MTVVALAPVPDEALIASLREVLRAAEAGHVQHLLVCAGGHQGAAQSWTRALHGDPEKLLVAAVITQGRLTEILHGM